MEFKKELIWGLGIMVAVVILTGYYIFNFNPPAGAKSLNSSSPAVSLGATLTTTEVQKHNQVSDCWLIIDNKVYSATDFLNLHPGGADRIIPYCGQDATQAFITKDGKGSHSQAAFQNLTQLYLGDVNGIIKQTPNPSAIKNLPRREEREENDD